MIDAHAHLDDARYAPDEIGAVLQRAAEAGIDAIILAAVNLDSAHALLDIAERRGIENSNPIAGRQPLTSLGPADQRAGTEQAEPRTRVAGDQPAPVPSLHVAVGFHPHEARTFHTDDLVALRALTAHPQVVAIGEIGLDYHYENSPRAIQLTAIEAQLTLARELDLPVVVHNRSAEEDMYPVLKASGARGILHCFSGNLAEAERYVALGFLLSIACTVTYPNAETTREVVRRIPLEYLLTETDSPYLPPQGLRGQRNEPAYVRAAVQKIAELKGVSEEDAAVTTAANAARLFRLPLTQGI